MPIFSNLKIGDVLQFPSGALKKLTKIRRDHLVFATLKNGKKRMSFTIDFVLSFCDLMPKDIDTQYFLNTTHLRRAIDVKAQTLTSDNSKTLVGYFIEDEMIDPPPEEELD